MRKIIDFLDSKPSYEAMERYILLIAFLLGAISGLIIVIFIRV